MCVHESLILSATGTFTDNALVWLESNEQNDPGNTPLVNHTSQLLTCLIAINQLLTSDYTAINQHNLIHQKRFLRCQNV